MIIKNKEQTASKNVRQIAGDIQEQDVAFYLRRAYKDDEKVFVFNDLRFEFNDEVAQIDHLILYPYGFVLIESKSITGEVKVNKEQEWTRSYNKQWKGIPSPIKQVEEQKKLLLKLLLENKTQLLPKFLFGLLQQGFAHRCWDNICAISSNAIIHRNDMPKNISKKLVKSEFVVDKLTKLMNIPTSKIISTLKAGESRPEFSTEALENISNFLLQQHKPIRVDTSQTTTPEPLEMPSKLNTPPDNTTKKQPNSISEIQIAPNISCKNCNETEQLQGAWGRYGYYVKCLICNTNTTMKQPCVKCNSKNTKISKKKAYYHLTCQDCNAHYEVFVQSPISEKTDKNNQPALH